MKDIDDVRRENLRRLEHEYGGPSAVAKVLEMSPSQFMNLRDGAKDSKTGKPRGMRKETARKIEQRAGKPQGWLDEPHPEQDIYALGDVTPASARVMSVEIPRFDTGGSMGNGVELRDQPGMIESWRVSREWIEKNVRAYSAKDKLCIVTGFGDSMQPLFNPGDPLLVDIGVRSVEFDAIYFFRVGSEGFVKRLQRIPTEGGGLVLRAKSQNADYEPWDITEKMDFEVFGRVLKVWCSRDF
ncbi:helix-turn-helix transcriptional regulator [Achromobacter ruhlandii]|uniref:S24 family peptidase n=1 Tax=Achromobacter ruhlandii TaxID=72557 RepID=UPI0035580010